MKLQRFVILAFIVGAILMGMVVESATIEALELSSITDERIFGLVATSTLIAVGSGAATFMALLRNTEAVKFTGEVIGELAKVTWPSREETVRATTTVICTTLFVAGLLFVYDQIWKSVADAFLFTQG
jgi:preprotein translocase SecE subunit